MEKNVEYTRKSRTICALDLGTFIDPGEGLDVCGVYLGKAHTFLEGQIVFIRCKGHWRKVGFRQNQTIMGPFLYARVPDTTMEDVVDQYKKCPAEESKLLTLLFSCFALFVFSFAGLALIYEGYSAFTAGIPWWPLAIVLCLFFSGCCFAVARFFGMELKEQFFYGTKYWLDQGNREHVLELGFI